MLKTESKLTFDSALHQYKLEGVTIPSITQVLKGTGIIDFSMVPTARLEAACLFGTAAHRATALSDKGTLDEDNLDNFLRPYLSGWRLFRQEYGFIPEVIEQPMYSKIYRVAGTPDRVGRWRIDDSLIIPDIKTGVELSAANALQLSAYEMIVKENLTKKEKTKRMSILLTPDGKYKIQEYKSKNDLNIFIAALSVYNWKGQNAK